MRSSTPRGHMTIIENAYHVCTNQPFNVLMDVGEEVIDAAVELNPDYAVARYPDAANGVPAQMYNERIARNRFEKAKLIVEFCRRRLQE